MTSSFLNYRGLPSVSRTPRFKRATGFQRPCNERRFGYEILKLLLSEMAYPRSFPAFSVAESNNSSLGDQVLAGHPNRQACAASAPYRMSPRVAMFAEASRPKIKEPAGKAAGNDRVELGREARHAAGRHARPFEMGFANQLPECALTVPAGRNNLCRRAPAAAATPFKGTRAQLNPRPD